MTKEEMEELGRQSRERQLQYLTQLNDPTRNPSSGFPGWLLIFIAIIFFISGAATVAIRNYYHG